MCGIFCCYNRSGDLASFRPRAIALSKKQRHRGPDWSGCYMGKDTVMVHERLAIVGVGESFSSSVGLGIGHYYPELKRVHTLTDQTLVLSLW